MVLLYRKHASRHRDLHNAVEILISIQSKLMKFKRKISFYFPRFCPILSTLLIFQITLTIQNRERKNITYKLSTEEPGNVIFKISERCTRFCFSQTLFLVRVINYKKNFNQLRYCSKIKLYFCLDS